MTKHLETTRLKVKRIVALLLLALFFIPVSTAWGLPQAETKPAPLPAKGKPRVFIDCDIYDPAALGKEISFVESAASRGDADVYILITSQSVPEGKEYTLAFSGEKEFGGIQQTLKLPVGKDETGEQEKQSLARTLKMGLMRYVGRTPLASRVNINFLDKVKPTDVVDKWHFWVFSLSANGFFSGEKLYNYRMFYGSFVANHVTPGWKIRMSLGVSHYKDVFTVDSEKIESPSNSRTLQGLVVKSVSEHWSVGGYVTANASSYQNIKLGLRFAPAVEYNLFPYSESTRRQLRFLYTLSLKPMSYREETIYDKTRESLLAESLEAALEIKQKWGTISTSLQGSHYFHDFSKYRVELYSEISVRIVKGLSFNINGGGSRIHDQLSLAKGGATYEEVLLRRKQIATTYEYYVSVGISYTFGSILSKIVNPRFGAGGSSISIRIGG
jgi:hypothetical protein